MRLPSSLLALFAAALLVVPVACDDAPSDADTDVITDTSDTSTPPDTAEDTADIPCFIDFPCFAGNRSCVADDPTALLLFEDYTEPGCEGGGCAIEESSCDPGTFCVARDAQSWTACLPEEDTCAGPDGDTCDPGQVCEIGSFSTSSGSWADHKCTPYAEEMYGRCVPAADVGADCNDDAVSCGCDGRTYASGCDRAFAGVPPADASNGGTSEEDDAEVLCDGPAPTTFRLTVTNDVPESIWVQLDGPSDQPGWVTVSRADDDTQLLLRERCGVQDCGGSPVCGLAPPRVRDITGGTPSGDIELAWDGFVSEQVTADACEVMATPPPGDYVASFCWSLEADVTGMGEPTEGVEGTVVDPLCVDVPFTLPDDDGIVEHVLVGG